MSLNLTKVKLKESDRWENNCNRKTHLPFAPEKESNDIIVRGLWESYSFVETLELCFKTTLGDYYLNDNLNSFHFYKG